MEGIVATSQVDTATVGLPFSAEDKQWLKLALLNQIKSLERMMAKYPAGSGAHTAHAADVAKIRKIMERFD